MWLLDVDAEREGFMEAVYNILSGDPDNVRANMIIDCYDNLPTVDALPLRCRIGDTVWVVGTKCLSGLYEDECDSRRTSDLVYHCENCPLDQEYIVFSHVVHASAFCSIHDLHDTGHFRWGETAFKTKQEAEAALAKMDQEEDDHGE